LGWAEYTKKGVVCQEGKTTKKKQKDMEKRFRQILQITITGNVVLQDEI
jgi:hypothetical protein